MRPSSVIITILNLITLAIGIIAIALSIWFITENDSPCHKGLQKPLLILGIAILAVSLLGLMGSCCRISFFLWIYLFVLFFLILGLMAFTVFTIIVTNKGVGRALSKRGVDDYKLGDYSKWLQKYVVNADNWDEIKSCMVEGHFCQRKPELVAKNSVSSTQSGCCKPPTYCGFEKHNETYWIMPKTGPAVPDSDCKTWSNNQIELCFDCNSCKKAVLDNIKREWRTLAIINLIILFLVIVIYSTGCCALRANRKAGYQKYGR